MLMIWLAACGYASYYPNPGAIAVDTATDPLDVPCGETWAIENVVVRVVSTAPVGLDLYQVDESCAEIWLGALSADPPLVTNGMPGAVYVARVQDDATVYDWLQVPYGQDSLLWEIR